MSLADLSEYKLILGSKSPRRHELLKGLDLNFEIRAKDVDESFPETLKESEIPEYLALKKAKAFTDELKAGEVVITSDTVVWLGDKVFNKPESREEAIEMIATLSGRSHTVITAVCILSREKHCVFHDRTKVVFGEISQPEIEWYIDNYQPFDKAGAYGIQEWIGYMGIERIEGSFYNVMGFPTRMFYVELRKFLNL
jgi:septum formation protein